MGIPRPHFGPEGASRVEKHMQIPAWASGVCVMPMKTSPEGITSTLLHACCTWLRHLPSAGTSEEFIEGLLLVGVHRSSWVWGLSVRGRVMKVASGTPIPESFKVHSRPSITNTSQYKLDAYTTQHITIFSKGAGGRV